MRQVINTSAGFQLDVVDETVDQWQKRLDACVRAQGGHFDPRHTRQVSTVFKTNPRSQLLLP